MFLDVGTEINSSIWKVWKGYDAIAYGLLHSFAFLRFLTNALGPYIHPIFRGPEDPEDGKNIRSQNVSQAPKESDTG